MATNRLYAQNNTTMPNASVTVGAGANGSAGKSGDPCLIGKIPGVLLGDAAADGTGIVEIDGIFSLSVKGTDGSNAAIAYGALIYFVAANTPPLSATASGVPFGHVLQGVASGATSTVPVQIGRKS